MKYKEYLSRDFYYDRDVDVRAKTVKVVQARKRHECLIGLVERNFHTIEPGELARCEKAIIDGRWVSCYQCLPCLDKIIEAER